MVHVYIDPRCGELRSQLAAALPTLSLVDEADLEKARAFVIQAGSWPQLERVITTHRQIHLPGMLPVIVLVDDAGRDAAERLVEAGQASEVLPDGASWETVAARIYYWTLERNAADKTNALFSVLNTIPAGVMILIDGEIAFANQLAAGSVRRELAALQGARLEELVHPDDRQFLVRVFRRDAADAGLESLDLRLIGEGDHWLGLRSRPIYFLDRPGFFLSVIDITETKLSDLKRAYQAQLLDLVEDAVITTDRDARITFWNQGAENLYGRPAAAVLGPLGGGGSSAGSAVRRLHGSPRPAAPGRMVPAPGEWPESDYRTARRAAGRAKWPVGWHHRRQPQCDAPRPDAEAGRGPPAGFRQPRPGFAGAFCRRRFKNRGPDRLRPAAQ